MVSLEVESLQLLRLCSRYFVSTVFPPFLVLKQPAFYWMGCGGQEHTHRVNFYLEETNIVQLCQGMSRPSVLFYLFPQYLTNSYPPQKITCTAKITVHLGNMPPLSRELYICQKHCRSCLSFLPFSWLPSFLQNRSILPFPPCLY